MIISQPVLAETSDGIFFSARIRSRSASSALPSTLWFSFPACYRSFISSQSDGFLVGLLPVAMAIGEDIIVEGSLSARLAYGIREYQRVLSAWWPKQFKVVKVECADFHAATSTSALKAVGSSFSGGVDSFYTLWKHQARNEDLVDYRVTHCLLINGFDKDVDMDNTGYFGALAQVYEPLMNSLGVTLLTSCTNLQQFRLQAIGQGSLHHSFGSAITASVLILGSLFSRYFLPASHTYNYETLVPMGAHPVLDHLLSTERVQIIHDGAESSRSSKIAAIAEWPATYQRLRVCIGKVSFHEQTGQLRNCCRCKKCLNTMITLDLLGRLRLYSTFHVPLSRRRIWTSDLNVFRYKEHARLACAQQRWDRVIDIAISYFLNTVVRSTCFHVYSRCSEMLRALRGK